MSYILDALNKADQARKEQEEHIEPQVFTSNPDTQPKQSYLLPVGALTLAISGLLFWLAPWQAEEATKVPVAIMTQPSASMAPELVPPQSQPLPQPETPHPQKPVQDAHQQIIPHDNQADVQPLSESSVETIPSLMDLPQHLLDALPAINISAHTYSEKNMKRMVIINNKVLHENRYISEQLLLRNITKKGVELEFNGTLFSMTTYDTWPY